MDTRFEDLDFPPDLHYLIEHQVWARDEGSGHFTVGITALGVALAGEIYMCRAKQAGSIVEQGRSIAVVELAKSIVSVKSPLNGIVREANPSLAQAPERVHTDPYLSGWIARIEAASASGIEHLVYGAAVRPAMIEHARLYGIDSRG
jgi:glycine cleavage system H protein